MLRWLVWIPFALGGCGGKSSDVDDKTATNGASTNAGSGGSQNSDSGADGDSSSDGDSGSSSNAASSNGDAASSGGSSTATSSGDAGSSGGSSGTGNGGATSAGDGSDGAGDATTAAGGGGSTATTSSDSSTTGNPKPPMDLVEGCAHACTAQTGSGCPGAPTADDCAGGCVVITRVESCNDVVREFFECVEGDATTSCSDDGDVQFDECVSEQLAAYACILRDAPDDDLEEPCETYCAAQAAAECEMSEDVSGCVLGCTAIPTILPTCEDSWRSLLECTEHEEFSCDEAGEPTVAGCVAEYLTFWACAYPEVGD